MNKLIKTLLATTLALASLVASAKETKKLWYYLEKNETGKSGTYYGYYASRKDYKETECSAFLQDCVNALAHDAVDTVQNGNFGLYRMTYLGNHITETVENITDTTGGYYTALLFRADDGAVYAAEAYSSHSKYPIFAPVNIFHELTVTNALGQSVGVETVRGYEGSTTCKFRLAADTKPLSVRTPDAPHITDMQMTTETIRITIDNACNGCRYRVITSTTLDDTTFTPDAGSEVIATADGDLELTTSIGEGRVRFYRVEALSEEL